MFLSREEIIELTGYTYKSKQVQWLRDKGFKHSIRRDGFPCVLPSHIDKVLGGTIATSKEDNINLKALEEIMNG